MFWYYSLGISKLQQLETWELVKSGTALCSVRTRLFKPPNLFKQRHYWIPPTRKHLPVPGSLHSVLSADKKIDGSNCVISFTTLQWNINELFYSPLLLRTVPPFISCQIWMRTTAKVTMTMVTVNCLSTGWIYPRALPRPLTDVVGILNACLSSIKNT